MAYRLTPLVDKVKNFLSHESPSTEDVPADVAASSSPTPSTGPDIVTTPEIATISLVVEVHGLSIEPMSREHIVLSQTRYAYVAGGSPYRLPSSLQTVLPP